MGGKDTGGERNENDELGNTKEEVNTGTALSLLTSYFLAHHSHFYRPLWHETKPPLLADSHGPAHNRRGFHYAPGKQGSGRGRGYAARPGQHCLYQPCKMPHELPADYGRRGKTGIAGRNGKL